MADTVTISTRNLDNILNRLEQLKRDVESLKKDKSKESRYGSDEWWRQEEKKATEDIKKGHYKVFDKAEDLINDLHKSLK